LIYCNVTSNPNAAWIWQQLIEATPWGRQPNYLIHDHDAVYGPEFGARLSKLGIIAERLVRSIRQECLDHMIVINERHLHAVLMEFIDYYNLDRPIGASGSKAPCLDPRYATDQSPSDRCWAACTTSMAGLVEVGSTLPPFTRSKLLSSSLILLRSLGMSGHGSIFDWNSRS
jgi:hypothetical protein